MKLTQWLTHFYQTYAVWFTLATLFGISLPSVVKAILFLNRYRKHPKLVDLQIRSLNKEIDLFASLLNSPYQLTRLVGFYLGCAGMTFGTSVMFLVLMWLSYRQNDALAARLAFLLFGILLGVSISLCTSLVRYTNQLRKPAETNEIYRKAMVRLQKKRDDSAKLPD
jgi:ABC-type Fe3+-siderophore transport system permease subunit